MQERVRPILVLLNPVSGNGRSRGLLEALRAGAPAVRRLAGLCGAGDPASWPVVETTAGTGNDWKLEAESHFRGGNAQALMAIGGDGTLTEAARFLWRLGKSAATVAMIPVPGGRGNDFIRGLNGYSLQDGEFWAWAEKRGTWSRRVIDLASCNGKIFLNMASIGYGGRVVEKAHHRDAFWSKTSLVYQVEGALALVEPGGGRCEVKADGRVVHADAFFGAFVGNGKANGSGLFWTRNACLDDGRIDGIVFPRPGVFEMLGALRAVKRATQPSFKHSAFQGGEIIFHFDKPVPLELDGDFAGEALSHEFKCLPGALTIWMA